MIYSIDIQVIFLLVILLLVVAGFQMVTEVFNRRR